MLVPPVFGTWRNKIFADGKYGIIILNYIMKNFGEEYKRYFIIKSKKYLDQDYLKLNNGVITSSIEGKFLSDGIASELFILNQLDLDLNTSVK